MKRHNNGYWKSDLNWGIHYEQRNQSLVTGPVPLLNSSLWRP